MCSACESFLTGSLARHSISCSGKKGFKIDLPVLRPITTEFSNHFKEHVLSTLRNDDIGVKVKSDRSILLFGSHDFKKTLKNPEKVFQTRITVRRNMRSLGTLYLIFLEKSPQEFFHCAMDMFHPVNFPQLSIAIKEYGQNDSNEVKGGAKTLLQYTLINAAKAFKAHAFLSDNKEEVDVFEKFLSILKIFENVLFGDGRYQLEINKQKKLKLPTELPLEEDMEALREYTVDVVKNYSSHSFVHLRDATCARITLYNGRRYFFIPLILSQLKSALRVELSRFEEFF